MIATYNTDAKKNFNVNYRKENKCFFSSYSALVNCDDHNGKPDMKCIVELRLYNTGQTTYAALWVWDGKYTNGTGKAGGYGYHKASAATSEAIRNAGIILDKDISGVGDNAIKDAIMAIVKMLGHEWAYIHNAHP